MKKFILSLVIGSAGFAGFSQAKLVQKITKKGNEIVIPYEKYVLPNGLTLVLHEDHSDPIVHVDVTYHVGSAREEIKKSGFAHFFEHMMFQGSDNVADEQHFKIVTESGGTLNGTTNRDRTNYFETVPSNQLEKMLWLEADRMGFLLDAVTQKKFEVQRGTVKNERGQNYDNRPYGLAGEVSAKNLYPYGHPYSWLTIGYVEDLDRVNVADLKNFFLRWYGPNNATITVGGDIKPQEVVKLVEKYFGSIAKGVEVKDMPAVIPTLDKDRYISYEDNFIRFPMLRITYPTPEARSIDETALDCLSEVLGQGKNSILYKNLVKSQQALQAQSFNSTSELAGEFITVILPSQGKTLVEMEKIYRQSLEEFEKRGITDEDIQKYIAGQEAQTVNSLSSVSGKVSTLAAYQTFENNPNFIQEEIKRFRNLKKEDVMKAYNKYIKGKGAVVLSIYPKGQKNIAADDNYTVNTSGYVAPNYGYDGLKYNKSKDNFERNKMPSNGANPVVKVPPFWKETLTNQTKIIGAKNDETPTVTLLLNFPKGQWSNPIDKAGLASLTSQMLNEGTEKYTAEQFASELDKLGSSVAFFAGDEEMGVQVQTLKKNLDKTLVLLQEKLYKPRFDVADFERLKKQTQAGIKNQQTQAAFVASDVYGKILYGKNDIRAVSGSGTAESVEKITLEDVKAFYNSLNLKGDFVDGSVVIVGDVEKAEIMPKLAFLGKIGKANEPTKTANTFIAAPDVNKNVLYLIDKPKAAQSEIRIGYVNPALKYDATGEYYKVGLMNYVLGTAFNSRINLNLREDKAWTYGARGSFSANDYDARYTASAGVKVNATDSSVYEFMKEIKNYADAGITDAELGFVKNSIGQSDALRYETSFQKAGFLGRIQKYNLPNNFVAQQNEILTKITKEDINALAKKYLLYNKMSLLVVGDKAVILKGLMRLGYQITELDANGNVIAEDVVKAENAKMEAEKAKVDAEKAKMEAEKTKVETKTTTDKKSKKKKK
jgi:zinc protease